jgi:hypothetical protein
MQHIKQWIRPVDPESRLQNPKPFRRDDFAMKMKW